MKGAKLYKVGLGLLEKDGNEITNWRSVNVVAKDAQEAMRKTRLRKNEYVEEVRNLQPVDVA